MEDSQHLCPDCGADYVEAVVNDIASGAGADSRLMLASLEEGLAGWMPCRCPPWAIRPVRCSLRCALRR